MGSGQKKGSREEEDSLSARTINKQGNPNCFRSRAPT